MDIVLSAAALISTHPDPCTPIAHTDAGPPARGGCSRRPPDAGGPARAPAAGAQSVRTWFMSAASHTAMLPSCPPEKTCDGVVHPGGTKSSTLETSPACRVSSEPRSRIACTSSTRTVSSAPPLATCVLGRTAPPALTQRTGPRCAEVQNRRSSEDRAKV